MLYMIKIITFIFYKNGKPILLRAKTKLSLQCFQTVEQAYSFVDKVDMDDPIIFVHSGLYQGEFLLIDIDVSIIGAGKMHSTFH